MAMTVVSATVVDSDGQAWMRGSWRLEFIPALGHPNLTQYRVDGATPLSSSVISQNGVMDNFGAFSVTLYDNTTVTPSGSSWKFTICPLSSAPCGFYTFAASGASLNISGALTFLLPAPRFLGVYPNYGYADLEVTPSNKPGSTYYNVTQQVQKYYDDQTQTWNIVGTGPSGSPGVPGPAGNPSITLLGTQDPNTLTTQGIYYLPDGMSAGSQIPQPPHEWNSLEGILEVFNYLPASGDSTHTQYIMQRYQTGYDFQFAPGEIFVRWYTNYSGIISWTSWVNVGNLGVYVNSPVDLKSFTDSGVYYFPDGVSNGPNPPYTINTAMSILEVFSYSNPALQYPYILQRFSLSQNSFISFGSPGAGEYFQRWYFWNGTANVWSPWYRYAPVGVA